MLFDLNSRIFSRAINEAFRIAMKREPNQNEVGVLVKSNHPEKGMFRLAILSMDDWRKMTKYEDPRTGISNIDVFDPHDSGNKGVYVNILMKRGTRYDYDFTIRTAIE